MGERYDLEGGQFFLGILQLFRKLSSRGIYVVDSMKIFVDRYY